MTGEVLNGSVEEENEEVKRPYKFDFSTQSELGAVSCCTKLFIYLLFIVLLCFLPAIKVYYQESKDEAAFLEENWYPFLNLIYVPLGASFILFLVGQFVAGIVAYPYSSAFFNKSYQR